MRRALPLLLLAVLLAPGAAAGVPFEMTLEDRAGDARQVGGGALAAPSADILSLTSRVENGTVVQEVRVAGPPSPPHDSMLLTSWFHHSENGSYWLVRIEVRGDAPQPEDRLSAVIIRETKENETPIDVKWGVRNDTWIFSFNESLVADATCFDPAAFSTYEGRRTSGGDQIFDNRTRHCTQPPPERPPPLPAPPIAGGLHADVPRTTEPTQAPPGTETPGAGAALAMAALLVALAARGARRR